jgi:hypothetical protein
MAKVISDIILTPVRILYSALATAVPVDTVAVGGSWGAGWTELGYTEAPLTMAYSSEEYEKEVQSSLAPVKRMRIREGLSLETVLAELDGAQLNLMIDGVLTATPAGVGQPGKEEIAVGGKQALTEKQWGFEGSDIDEDAMTFPVRVFVWKATATAGVSLEFAKEKSTGVSLKIKALADLTKTDGQRLFKIQKILEPAS